MSLPEEQRESILALCIPPRMFCYECLIKYVKCWFSIIDITEPLIAYLGKTIDATLVQADRSHLGEGVIFNF